jgi:hypothetical protein
MGMRSRLAVSVIAFCVLIIVADYGARKNLSPHTHTLQESLFIWNRA